MFASEVCMCACVCVKYYIRELYAKKHCVLVWWLNPGCEVEVVLVLPAVVVQHRPLWPNNTLPKFETWATSLGRASLRTLVLMAHSHSAQLPASSIQSLFVWFRPQVDHMPLEHKYIKWHAHLHYISCTESPHYPSSILTVKQQSFRSLNYICQDSSSCLSHDCFTWFWKQMGFFDAIGKALADSMSNDENLGKKENPGFRVSLPPFVSIIGRWWRSLHPWPWLNQSE